MTTRYRIIRIPRRYSCIHKRSRRARKKGKETVETIKGSKLVTTTRKTLISIQRNSLFRSYHQQRRCKTRSKEDRSCTVFSATQEPLKYQTVPRASRILSKVYERLFCNSKTFNKSFKERGSI